MSHFNTILYQLQQFLPRHDFEKLVSEHNGDKYSKSFSCNNLLTILLSFMPRLQEKIAYEIFKQGYSYKKETYTISVLNL